MRSSPVLVALALSLCTPAVAAAQEARPAAKARPATKAKPAANENEEPAAKTAASKDETSAPAEEKPAAATRPAAAKDAPRRPDLGRAAVDAAARAPGATRPMLDLTPSVILGAGLLTGDRRGAEQRKGIAFGGDGDGRVHAAQVGAMAFGFAALTALCSGGACLLPEGLTDWIPGTRDDPFGSPAEMRPPQSLRQAR